MPAVVPLVPEPLPSLPLPLVPLAPEVPLVLVPLPDDFRAVLLLLDVLLTDFVEAGSAADKGLTLANTEPSEVTNVSGMPLASISSLWSFAAARLSRAELSFFIVVSAVLSCLPLHAAKEETMATATNKFFIMFVFVLKLTACVFC